MVKLRCIKHQIGGFIYPIEDQIFVDIAMIGGFVYTTCNTLEQYFLATSLYPRH